VRDILKHPKYTVTPVDGDRVRISERGIEGEEEEEEED